MTLDEAFSKYDDSIKLRRTSLVNLYKNSPDIDLDKLEKYLKEGGLAHDIEWLKGLKVWGNEESRKMGFLIPQHMIEDANADDWEIVE